jgi:hypothetical protein
MPFQGRRKFVPGLQKRIKAFFADGSVAIGEKTVLVGMPCCCATPDAQLTAEFIRQFDLYFTKYGFF